MVYLCIPVPRNGDGSFLQVRICGKIELCELIMHQNGSGLDPKCDTSRNNLISVHFCGVSTIMITIAALSPLFRYMNLDSPLINTRIRIGISIRINRGETPLITMMSIVMMSTREE